MGDPRRGSRGPVRLTLPILIVAHWVARPRTIVIAAGVVLVGMIVTASVVLFQIGDLHRAARRLRIGDNGAMVAPGIEMARHDDGYGTVRVAYATPMQSWFSGLNDDAERKVAGVRHGEKREAIATISAWARGYEIQPEEWPVVVELRSLSGRSLGVVRRVWVNGDPVREVSDREFEGILVDRWFPSDGDWFANW